MLKNQKELFRIPDNVSYLNCATMSPLLKSVEIIGHKAVTEKCTPFTITSQDFFTNTQKLKEIFATLVSIEDARNIAIIPSVSYGIANVANNIKLAKNDEIIVVGDQFPSNMYSWIRIAENQQAKIKLIKAPNTFKNRGEIWNESILEAINDKTKIVAIGNIHWSDGTLFNLKAIREKTKLHNALLIIDGTQSVGVMPFSVKELQPDALICGAYKWLLGPYSIGLAYYSDALCENAIPIEENWINRKNSEDFTNLVNYQEEYQPKAGRFNVGEMSNFMLTPMLFESISQLIKWQPKNIENYTKEISKSGIKELQNLGCFIEEENYRAKHLFGIYLPKHIDAHKLKEQFAKNNIYVSFRGNAIRISCHLYNTKSDFDKLVACFKAI